MDFDIRRLTKTDELNRCIELQKEIWGLDDQGAMSPITLKALSMAQPPVGLVLGAFDMSGETPRMIGMSVTLGSLEPGLAYGHMLGILDEYRDHDLGTAVMRRVAEELSALGVTEVAWTYEPMESRNANVYINRMGGRGISYHEDYYHVQSAMHEGLPMDRLLVRAKIGSAKEQPEKVSLEEALVSWPVASPEGMPDSDTVLVRIPGELAALKQKDMDEARLFRMESRALFIEYINRRGYAATGFVTDVRAGERESYYILTRGAE